MSDEIDYLTHDILTPLDRYPGSPTFGIEVLNFIALWDEPGRRMYEGHHMTGALSPHTTVKLLGYCVIGSVLWAQVEAHQGGKLQKGWCTALVLDKVGAAYLAAISPSIV